ncbi:hypothetical protein GJ496_004062 [Pomphorhynchus laevis]|nr:hypothetical protein GJ496_004062 [Pomphorhynchus laevis]
MKVAGKLYTIVNPIKVKRLCFLTKKTTLSVWRLIIVVMTTGDEYVSLKNILQHQNRLLERLIGQSSGTTTGAEHSPISVYRQFTKNIESWSDYTEQLEHHFKSQGVEKDVQKKQFLLSWVGPETYQMINQLNAGQTIEDVSFAQILQLPAEHFVKPTHAITSREWLARLKEEARNCHFYKQTIVTEKQAIDDRINDNIVMNTPHSSVRNSLLQMDSPLLDEVLRVCNTHELIQSSHRIMSSKDQEGQVEALRIKQET